MVHTESLDSSAQHRPPVAASARAERDAHQAANDSKASRREPGQPTEPSDDEALLPKKARAGPGANSQGRSNVPPSSGPVAVEKTLADRVPGDLRKDTASSGVGKNGDGEGGRGSALERADGAMERGGDNDKAPKVVDKRKSQDSGTKASDKRQSLNAASGQDQRDDGAVQAARSEAKKGRAMAVNTQPAEAPAGAGRKRSREEPLSVVPDLRKEGILQLAVKAGRLLAANKSADLEELLPDLRNLSSFIIPSPDTDLSD